MLQQLFPNFSTILTAIIVFTIVGAVVVKLVRDKINHKSSCGGGCSGCTSCSTSHLQSKPSKHQGLL